MAHEAQERYSDMVLAKVRAELVLKDGTIFNNDYEGDPVAGVVKIPTRDDEVAASDYDKANGLAPTNGSTAYVDLPINKDKAVNEIIDGYDADAVPDNLVADRLDSAGYSMAKTIDTDGATALLGGGTAVGITTVDKDTVYAALVDQRTAMSKANIPATGRYALITPDYIGVIAKSDQFTQASSLGDEVKQSGAIGRIAGFSIFEWNDATANLFGIFGHPRFATRVNAWKVPVKLQNLDASGKYIGASAVQGRIVYAHKVLRSAGVRCVYAPSMLALAASAPTTLGKTKLTVTDAAGTATSFKYVVNPTARQVYGAVAAGTALTSGTTEIAVTAGDVIEVVGIASTKVVSVGYHTVVTADIGTGA
ncbi:MAG TPA: hypothetical protein PLP25_00225 [Candidatus Limiplasma sp.]|nr:hypothetical protein [Candidatus Limiplasma sp.]HPS80267.1 hypothetical protein [Candidatus Limiplasma sp.]